MHSTLEHTNITSHPFKGYLVKDGKDRLELMENMVLRFLFFTWNSYPSSDHQKIRSENKLLPLKTHPRKRRHHHNNIMNQDSSTHRRQARLETVHALYMFFKVLHPSLDRDFGKKSVTNTGKSHTQHQGKCLNDKPIFFRHCITYNNFHQLWLHSLFILTSILLHIQSASFDDVTSVSWPLPL